MVDRTRGVTRDVVTYTAQRIRDVGALREGENPAAGSGLDVLTGADKPLVVRVYGQDLATLQREAEKVQRIVSEVDGVVDPRIELRPTQPTLEIEVDLDKARRFGVKPGDVRRAEATLLQGIQVGSVFQEQKVFEVIVQGVPETRDSVAERAQPADRPSGRRPRPPRRGGRRADRADARRHQRDAVSRHVDIEAGVSGRSLGAVATRSEDRLADVSFPLEYHAEVLKRRPARRSAPRR